MEIILMRLAWIFFTRLKELPEKGKQFNEFMAATSLIYPSAGWW
jgi:hypothetical protein